MVELRASNYICIAIIMLPTTKMELHHTSAIALPLWAAYFDSNPCLERDCKSYLPRLMSKSCTQIGGKNLSMCLTSFHPTTWWSDGIYAVFYMSFERYWSENRKDLSNSMHNISIAAVESSWTTDQPTEINRRSTNKEGGKRALSQISSL